jgi:L-malate glycosyltransferase
MAKIAYISIMAGSPWGGSEYLWAGSAKKALENGHDVYLSIYDWSVSHPVIQDLIALGAHILPRKRHPRSWFFLRRAVRKLVRRSPYQDIFDIHPDIICVNQGSTCDIAYFPDLINLATSSNIPYMTICQHNMDLALENQHRQLVNSFFSKANRVLFVSQSNLDLAKRQLASPLPNASVVQNPVNISSIDPEIFPPSSTIKFASVARFDVSNKGQDLLLESLSSEKWKDRDWECNFYGTGEDLDYLQKLTALYKIHDRVKFKGHVSDVRKIWAENHILVLPSRAEGTPLSLMEAMLCGRPSVVTDVGGNIEWVSEGETGFISPATTVSSFQAALERAWQAKDNWERMGNSAHDIAISKFDTNPAKTLLEIILNSIGEKS